jgi:hypothetical protein
MFSTLEPRTNSYLPPKPRTFRECVFVCSHYYPIYFILTLHLSIWFSPSMIYTLCNSVELLNPPSLPWIRYTLEYSIGEMLQWYFRVLADSCNH